MKQNNKWNELTMQQKADLMKLYVANGYTNLDSIKENYNGTPYASFNSSSYDYYHAHEDNMPKEEGEHYSSRNPVTGEILKSENHPTRYLADRGEAQEGMTMYKNKLNGRTFTTESDLGNLYGYEKVPIKSYVDNPEELALRVEWAESKGNPNAVSNKGAVGLNQITKVVYNDYIAETGDVGDLRDPSYNRKIRDWHLNKLNRSRTIHNNNPSEEVKLAKQYGAYNYGQGKLGKALEKAKNKGVDIYNTLDWVDTKYIPKETVDYINFVVRGLDSTDKGSHRTEDQFYDYYVNNKTNNYDDGGPIGFESPFKDYSTVDDIPIDKYTPEKKVKSYTPKDEGIKRRLLRTIIRNGDLSMHEPFKVLNNNKNYILFNEGEGYGNYDGIKVDPDVESLSLDTINSFVQKGSPTDIYLNNTYDSTLYEPVDDLKHIKYINKTIQEHKKKGRKLNYYKVKGDADTIRISSDEFNFYNRYSPRRKADGWFSDKKGNPVYDAGHYTEIIENPNDSTVVITPIDVFDFMGIGNSEFFSGRDLSRMKNQENRTNSLRTTGMQSARSAKYSSYKSPIKKAIGNAFGNMTDNAFNPFVMQGIPTVYIKDEKILNE